MSQRIIDWKSGVATTVNASVVTVTATDVIPDGTTVTLDIFLQGRETTSLTNFGEIASTHFIVQATRIAGVLSLVGTPTVVVSFAQGSNAALAGASAAVDVSANTLRLRATGVVGFTLEWFGDMRPRIN